MVKANKIIKEYSIPLILGVIVAMIMSNLNWKIYSYIIHSPILGDNISLHWIVNDVFMTLFFASATIEIISSLGTGGPLNPISKAITPIMATMGGVIGPIIVFFTLNHLIGMEEYSNGWGIVTATDIALAWLIAKIVFGKNHPAISFLLLIAVADDAIGVLIVALFYQDPMSPVKPLWLCLVIFAMIIASTMKKKGIKHYRCYVLGPGFISWFGLYSANMHAALALVFIVPFMPAVTAHEVDNEVDSHGVVSAKKGSTLYIFEERIGNMVDYGLFFFGFACAGVLIDEFSSLTIIVFLSLFLGKTLGISFATFFATSFLKLELPNGMEKKEVFVAAITAGIGLTVALFVAESAYVDVGMTGSAKLGALLSVVGGLVAIMVGRMLKIKRQI